MFQPRPQTQRIVACCATVITPRGTTLRARLAHKLLALTDAMVAWRCRQHEAWHRHQRRKLPF